MNSMVGVACWLMPREAVCKQQGRHHQHVRQIVGRGHVKLYSLRFVSLFIFTALEHGTCVQGRSALCSSHPHELQPQVALQV